jgi:hypothetical protein
MFSARSNYSTTSPFSGARIIACTGNAGSAWSTNGITRALTVVSPMCKQAGAEAAEHLALAIGRVVKAARQGDRFTRGGLGQQAQAAAMILARRSGMDSIGECEESSSTTVVGLVGKAASASAMNLRCSWGRTTLSRRHST